MSEEKSQSESRRRFLKTTGKFAIYTPPALFLMSKANANHSDLYKSVKPNGIRRGKRNGQRRSYGRRRRYGRRGLRRRLRRFFS